MALLGAFLCLAELGIVPSLCDSQQNQIIGLSKALFPPGDRLCSIKHKSAGADLDGVSQSEGHFTGRKMQKGPLD